MKYLVVFLSLAMLFIFGQNFSVPNEPKAGSDFQELQPVGLGSPAVVGSRLVEVTNYGGGVMEPHLSRDGLHLFFNNPKMDGVQNIHWATKISDYKYQYRGLLLGANSHELDAVPTMDDSGNFYFTSMRIYSSSGLSVFHGVFDASNQLQLTGPIDQQFSSDGPGQINMDAGVSADGQSMYLARATFNLPPTAFPAYSDIELLSLTSGRWTINPRGQKVLHNINTPDHIEYAPEISTDGLRLYFTRAKNIEPGKFVFYIMVSERENLNQEFGLPRNLITGSEMDTPEGPTLSSDESMLYYHAKDEQGIYRLWVKKLR